MKVRELIAWLQAFPDQDATVEVLHCTTGQPYYQQGGVTGAVEFDPEKHAEYTDMRGNQWAKGKPWENSHTLLLGLNEG
jgi:hypothetical protein